MKKKPLKTFTLEEQLDKHIGPAGTPEREKFEFDLQMDLLGDIIKKARQTQHLTQEELGTLIGVQKAQISKLENNTTSARLDTILKVFNALKAKVTFKVQLENEEYLFI